MGDPDDRLKVVCAFDSDLARARGTVLRPPSAVSSIGGFRTPAAEYAAPSLKRPASETLHNNGSGAFLFKDLVRASEKRRRDFETQRFRCLEIDSKQEFGGLLDRKLGRFGTFQNSIDIVSPAPCQGGLVRPVRNQSARLRMNAGQIHRR